MGSAVRWVLLETRHLPAQGPWGVTGSLNKRKTGPYFTGLCDINEVHTHTEGHLMLFSAGTAAAAESPVTSFLCKDSVVQL